MGRLSDAFGYGLEDVGRVVLPGWLQRHLGIEVEDLRREYFMVDGREIEVNLYGEGLLRGEKTIILCEASSKIYEADVRSFHSRVYTPLAERLEGKVIGVLFGYLIHPSARRVADELGLYVVAAYQR